MPKDDLYKTLGINKASDKKAIKDAYRKKEKKEHPDAGGSPEKFGALKRAYDVLSDDKRREKYDSTGDIDEKTPDNAYSCAVNIISYAFSGVLQECAQSGTSPLEIDVLSEIKSKIRSATAENNKNIRILKNVLETDKNLTGRFKTKSPDNVFEGIIANRISSIQINIATMEKNIVDNNAALELIKDFSYKQDDKPYESPGDKMMSRMNAGFTFCNWS